MERSKTQMVLWDVGRVTRIRRTLRDTFGTGVWTFETVTEIGLRRNVEWSGEE